MSQIPGLCVLLFAEEGLWNRIVPPLPPHILDRIHEPIHLTDHGLVRNVRLRTPTMEQLVEVVNCRVRRNLAGLEGVAGLPAGFPFGAEFLSKLARRESVLRLMLQGCCNRLDEILEKGCTAAEAAALTLDAPAQESPEAASPAAAAAKSTAYVPPHRRANREPLFRPVGEAVAEPTKSSDAALSSAAGGPPSWDELKDRWFQEVRAAERKLKPVGSLAAATAELQGGLVRWLHVCRSLGVEQEAWRVSGVVDQITVGDHPSYGALTVVLWTAPDQAEQRCGVGLWLGRGVGKPRDLETKLDVFKPAVPPIDSLILLRPADDARLSGKTRDAWDQAAAGGRKLRLEPVDLEIFAKLYAFPRWMQQVVDAFGDAPLPEAVYLFLAEETEPIMLRLGLPTDGGDRAKDPASFRAPGGRSDGAAA
ncbi:MAG: hypothetical protein ACRC1K_17310, partial [Planctomycetia bacterium]